MLYPPHISRREFLQSSSLLIAASALPHPPPTPSLDEFGYGDITLASELHEAQLRDTVTLLMDLSDDDLLKPFRAMAGQAAPGSGLGGWYDYLPDYDYHSGEAGLAPSATFGQWISALARSYAVTKSQDTRDKVLRLNRLYGQTLCGDYYERNRFPAYCYDKLVCGLIDSHQFAADPNALAILDRTTDTALPHLPGKAIDREHNWRPGKDQSFSWDEPYTLPENLFLASQRGGGERYRKLAMQYLDDETYFDPVARGENVLGSKHAYSYVNALSSAMQAYLVAGSEKHLRAAVNAFDMIREQSFATGGWGPDEVLSAPGSGALFTSLSKSHNSFETPCGAYAHMKLSRYLLRATRDTRYCDSMERVMYNTVLGAKPLRPDGSAFYCSDYNNVGHKVYSVHKWPCCSGTLPQAAADYRINTYFHDSRGVYINLYIPSTLRWQRSGVQLALIQQSDYPFGESIEFRLATSQAIHFGLHFRIPGWAKAASLRVNGKRSRHSVVAGRFASIERTWKNGDRVQLELPLPLRLEAIDPQHPNTVALLSGPLVLFPITDTPHTVTREQLLAAKRTHLQQWQIDTANGPLTLLPFTSIQEQAYSTYITVP